MIWATAAVAVLLGAMGLTIAFAAGKIEPLTALDPEQPIRPWYVPHRGYWHRSVRRIGVGVCLLAALLLGGGIVDAIAPRTSDGSVMGAIALIWVAAMVGFIWAEFRPSLKTPPRVGEYETTMAGDRVRFDSDLEVADAVMRTVAEREGWDFVANADRGAWPSRGVLRGSGDRREEYRIELNPGYLRDSRPFYVLDHVSWTQPPSGRGTVDYWETLRRYSIAEIQDAARVQRDIDAVFEGPRRDPQSSR